MFSVIIPVFNERDAVASTVQSVHDSLSKSGEKFEILVVDDASTDGTAEVLKKISLPNVSVYRQAENRGYSSSIKVGIRHAQGDILGITDADGTYPVDEFPKFLEEMRRTQADMVVGKRPKQQIPFIRRPAKAFINLLVRFLTGAKIPDLNSGMRIFTKDLALAFMHLYPQRFSFTMTITLGAFTNDYIVRYLPITYGKRIGTSTMSSGFNGLKNFAQFCSLVIRIVTYFRPLRFFLWPAVLLFVGGLVIAGYTMWFESNVSDSGMLLIVSGLQIGLFGLVAEAIARNRMR